MGSLDRIEAVAEQVIRTRQQGHQVVVVLSAMAGETNRLIDMAQQLDKRPSSRELDVLMSVGEQVSVSLLAIALIKRGYSAISMLADQVGIKTDSRYGKARIEAMDTARFETELEQGHIVIAAGFQGRDEENNVTTLGRGGSDTTAVAIAAALQAEECQIFTDVDGVYTADPRIVSGASLLDKINFSEMLELASQGAKVLQNRAVELAGKYQVPLRVLSSFTDAFSGTLINYEDVDVEKQHIAGVTYHKDLALVTLTSKTAMMTLLPQVLAACQQQGIDLDLMVQNPQADGSMLMSVSMAATDLAEFKTLLEDFDDIQLSFKRSDVAKVSVVGLGVKSHSNVSKRMFETLQDERIQPLLMATSEISISVLIEQKYVELAVRSLHECYELGS